MPVNYPGSPDEFNEPSLPEYTSLSSAGTGTRAHVQHHHDLGQALIAVEDNASFKDHDHSGDGTTAHGDKLDQANTHENADTDTAATAIHHTVDTPTGSTPLKAAPANHIHDYNDGTLLLHRPYIICTTTTRPATPFVGLQIYETDTNTVRVWAVFPTNPNATGIIWSDNFHRTSSVDLGPIWRLLYRRSSRGRFCTPTGLWAWWIAELAEDNWCLAQRDNGDDDDHTDSDDQEIECTWGDEDFDHHHEYGDDGDKPCNDHFFRMSDDCQHYVRVAIFYSWIVVYYTVDGPDNEEVLGTIFIPVWEPGLIWTIQCIDWGIHIYRNGVHCGSIFDNDHRHYRDSSHRRWGFGCHVMGHSGGQWRPCNITHCQIKDRTSYSPVARWGLLPVANIPILIAEAHTTQEVLVGVQHRCRWTHILEDWLWWYRPFWPWRFMDLDISDVDVTIPESGVYHVSASLCWDPQRTFHDHSMISIIVNGQDVRRKNWEFVRGYNYVPGFSQTNEINFWYRFNAGDKVHVIASHNATRPSWLWWDDDDPDRQTAHLELVYHSP